MKNLFASRYFYLILSAFFYLLTVPACNQSSKNSNTAGDSSGYRLVWSDEFNGKAVDTTSRNFQIGGNGWGNHEQEYYQPANATISNGNLVIEGRREDLEFPDAVYHYTS